MMITVHVARGHVRLGDWDIKLINFRFPIPICRSVSNISRNVFVHRGAAVMSGDRRRRTKMELSIFHRRRSIPFRSRLRLDCSVSGSRSVQVISMTKSAGAESFETRAAWNDRRPRRRFVWPGINTLVDNVLARWID